MLITISKTATYPVSLAELKRQRRYDGTANDLDYQDLIAQATEQLERDADRTLTPTTYKKLLPCFRRRIWLPAPPLTSVTSVRYYDSNNELQTLENDRYYVLSPTWTQGFIELEPQWPATYCRPDAVEINFTAGTWDVTPLAVKRAVLQVAAYLDSDRDTQQQNFNALQRVIDSVRHEGYPC